MRNMVEIIPSVLVKTKEEFLKKMMAVEECCARVHLDIADGIFVPNMTISGFQEMREMATTLKAGVHLMVSKPENHLLPWLDNPAVESITFHVEATKKYQEVVMAVKEAEKMVGVALNPGTALEAIKPFIDDVDFVHFMTVEPGFYGGQFVEAVLEKITDCQYFYPDKLMVADGGVTPASAPQLVRAGASLLIVGSYLWNAENIGDAIREIKESIV